MGKFETTTDTLLESVTEEDPQVWIPFVEPVPDFDEALWLWGPWWQIHTYGVGILFFMVTIFCTVHAIAFCVNKVHQRAYFITLNILVIIFSAERGVFMFLDPYNASGTLPPAVAYIFLSIGLPCMTSAFYLIFVAWVKATKFKISTRIHKTRTMVIIIVLHFALSIAFDIGAGFTLQAVPLLILCQAMFVAWGGVLSIMFFYLYVRIYVKTVKPREELRRLSARTSQNSQKNSSNKKAQKDKEYNHTTNNDNFNNCGFNNGAYVENDLNRQPYMEQDPYLDYHRHAGKNYRYEASTHLQGSQSNAVSLQMRQHSTASTMIPKLKVPLGAKLILVTAVLLFIIACLYLGGIFGCYTLQIISGKSPEPWPWWGYELSLRLCEIALCWTISIAATKPITAQLAKRLSSRIQSHRRRSSRRDSGQLNQLQRSDQENRY